MTHKITLADILPHLPDHQLHFTGDPAAITIAHVTDDSREVRENTFFVALTGQSFDGHRFFNTAMEQGAVALMGTASPGDLPNELPNGIPYIQVVDSRVALAWACAACHGFPSREMTVIGITGTDGKTTTTTILEAILIAATNDEVHPNGQVGVITTIGARICGDEQDTGFHVTTPTAPHVQRFLAQMRDGGCQYAIVESTSHGLAQARVAAVEYDIAAVTNITHEHINDHGSRVAYVDAKAELFRMLGSQNETRCAILNLDDTASRNTGYGGSYEPLVAALHESIPRRSYSLTDEVDPGCGSPDVWASDMVYGPDQTRFQLHWWNGSFAMETQLIGDFNIANILCAATVSLSLGIDPQAIQQGVANLSGVLGRMERIDEGQPFLAIVDFAHSPVSLEQALLTLRRLMDTRGTESGRLISVFGSAGLRDKAKRGLMGRASGRLADFTIITAEDPRTEDLAVINQEIAAGVQEFASDDRFMIVPDRTEAIQTAINMAKENDVVGIFGKGHERSMCFGTTEYPWSDQDAVREALRNL